MIESHPARTRQPRPDIVIRPLQGKAEYDACLALQDRTWGAGFTERVPPTILRIAQDLGGIASGAFDGEGRLVGFVFGVTGIVDGRPLHWSDMLAVAPEARNTGVGDALKRHQRALLLERGVDTVQWTYDPLEARNAYLNLSRLGAVARDYRRDCYEGSDSPLHAGIGTDRLIVTWLLSSERVDRRMAGVTHGPTLAEVAHTVVLNRVVAEDPPRCAEPDPPPDAEHIRIAVPSDIQALRDRDVGLARAWREATRHAFELAFGSGFEARELVRDGAVGWYLLSRPAQPTRERRDFIS